MVPAIGLAKARIDIVDRVVRSDGPVARMPPAAIGIRLPPGMRTMDGPGAGAGRGNL